MGTVRVLSYTFFASLLIGGLAARKAVADLKDGTLEAGREMAQLDDVLGETKTMFVNGTVMNVSDAFTNQSPSEVLDRFETLCDAHPDAIARALSDIPATLQATVEKTVPNKRLRMGIIRADVRDEGALTCFTDDQPLALKDLPARLEVVRQVAQSERARSLPVRVREQDQERLDARADGLDRGELQPEPDVPGQRGRRGLRLDARSPPAGRSASVHGDVGAGPLRTAHLRRGARARRRLQLLRR